MVVLGRRGVVDTSLRTIAAELGTTSRMLVHYFGTKDHLIEAILARTQQDLMPEDEPPPSTVSALRARLLQDWEAMTGNGIDSGGRILCQIVGAACSQDSLYAEYATQLIDQLTTSLRHRLTAVGVPPDVAEFRAIITIAATQGLIARRAISEDVNQVDANYRRLLDTFVLAALPAPKQRASESFYEPAEERLRQPRLR